MWLKVENEVIIPVNSLYDFMKDVFISLGYPEEHAKASADVLIESDLRGIPSHGVQRLKYYYVRVKAGQHIVSDYEVMSNYIN